MSSWFSQLPQRLYRKEFILPALVCFIPFVVYCYTAPNTVTQEDSGRFILSAYFLGINHPTGYPLHTLLGKIFTLVVPGTIAFRVHLLSIVSACVAMLSVYHISLRLQAGRIPAFLGVLALGFSTTFWFQAVIAEVYMLTAALLLGAYWISLRLSEDFETKEWYLFCFILGLSMSAHLSLTVFAVPAFLPLLGALRKHGLRKLSPGIFFLTLGLAPYLHVILGVLYTDYHYGFPPRSIGELFDFLARKEFRARESADAFHVDRALEFALPHFKRFLREVHFPGFLLFLVGLWAAVRRWKPGRVFSLLWLLLYTLSILLFWRTDHNYLSEWIWRSYHLLPLAAFAIFLIQGLDRFYKLMPHSLAEKIYILLCALGLVGLVAYHWKTNNLRKDTLSEEHARISLDYLPPNAVLVVWGNEHLGPIGYVNKVLGVRPDVTLVDQNNGFFPDRIYPESVPATSVGRAIAAYQFFKSHLDQGRRIFSTSSLLIFKKSSLNPFSTTNSGLLFEIHENSPELHSFPPEMAERSSSLMRRFMTGEFPANFKGDRRKLLEPYCRYFRNVEIDHEIHQETECRIDAGESLMVRKSYAEADEMLHGVRFQDEQLPSWIQKHYLFLFMNNRLRWIETDPDLSEEKKSYLLQEAVDLTFPDFRTNGCMDPLLFSFKKLIDVPAVEFDREFAKRKLNACSGMLR